MGETLIINKSKFDIKVAQKLGEIDINFYYSEPNKNYFKILYNESIRGELCVHNNNVIIKSNESIILNVNNSIIKEISIEDGIETIINLETIRNSKEHVYKYITVGKEQQTYIRDLIMGNKLRCTNAYYFNDMLETIVRGEVAYSYHKELSCNSCELNKDNKCIRKNMCTSCIKRFKDDCIYKGYLDTEGFDKSNGIHTEDKCILQKDINNFIDKNCAKELVYNEIYHRYIYCVTHDKLSYALIEKFCKRFGLILEYEQVDKSKSINIEYADRPIATFGTINDLAYSITQNGYCSNNNDNIANKIIGYKLSEFRYENETRIIIKDIDNHKGYKDVAESELGLELKRIFIVYDSNLQGLNKDIIDTFNIVGKAIQDRGIIVELINNTNFQSNNLLRNHHKQNSYDWMLPDIGNCLIGIYKI